MVPMAENRVVVYKGPGEVAVENIEYPKLEIPEEVASSNLSYGPGLGRTRISRKS
jgi:hypothetical protein